MELIALCRAGFEKEVAAELSGHCSAMALSGYAKTQVNCGYVQFVFHNAEQARTFIESIPFRQMIFVRHWMLCSGVCADLGAEDRATPLVGQLKDVCESFGITAFQSLGAINLDTNDGKSLAKLAKGVIRHVERACSDMIEGQAAYEGQLLFLDGQSAFIGLSPRENCSLWEAGIPRLRLPKQAPSRATLKLEEAWHHFIPANQWDRRLAPGMQAVDLGAAPGGWTWQLVRRSMFVTAVDNGPMAESLMDSGQVQHHQLDGFQFQPQKAVDWLVCDIADKPARVASMIAQWAGERWFSEAVFNLKLPMKQRYQEVMRCKEKIEKRLESTGIGYELRFKQLYHDREEVTGHLVLKH